MSNESLKNRMVEALESFKLGNSSVASLKDSIELNGQALENMSYDMIKEVGDIEYLLTMSQFDDEEDSETEIKDVIPIVESWLSRIQC